MKRNLKRLFCLLLSAALLLGAFPLAAGAVETGSCGDALAYTIDNNGVLTISGTGKMTDWEYLQDEPYSTSPFAGREDIKKIVIQAGATSIGKYAFYGCKNAESVTIPTGVTEIGAVAFRDCASLKRVDIPKGVSYIPSSLFEGCKSLESVTIPDGVTYIREYAFCECTSLTSISLPNSINKIYNSVFERCSALKSIVIPEKVTEINSSLFSDCSSLENVTIPEGVTKICRYAFSGCTSLESINLPKEVTLFDEGIFYECSALKSVVIPNGVTVIDWNTFYGCSSLESVTIPEGVTTIEARAFMDCPKLASVTLPASVTTIADNAFDPTTTVLRSSKGTCGPDLTYEISGDTLTITGTGPMTDYAASSAAPYSTSPFAGNAQIKNIVIGENVTTIGDYAFTGIAGIETVALPSKTEKIGAHAFDNCVALKNITLPAGVSNVGAYAFNNCKALSKIALPNGLQRVNEGVFSGCENLAEVTLPKTLVSIGSKAFQNCGSLKNISIPMGTSLIESFAFSGCTGLTQLTLPETLMEIGNHAFFSCMGLETLTFNGAPALGASAFQNCTALSKVTFSQGMETIGSSAFMGCEALAEITLPASVKTVEENAFNGCDQLSKVNYGGTLKEWSEIAFADGNDVLKNYNPFPDHEHTWDGGQLVKQPTVSETGEAVYTCTECGFTRTVTLDKLIEFGSYPQSLVTDQTLIDELKKQPVMWKNYGYYSGTGKSDDGMMEPGEFMQFADFTYKGNKYRVVSFDKYRPAGTGDMLTDQGTFQSENNYEINTPYFFLYEPIAWRVLNAEEGLIMAEPILDAQAFQNTVFAAGGEYWQNSAEQAYASDYARSSIRAWLNFDFYETAFTAAQKENIRNDVDLSNNAMSDTQYDSLATRDKIFLLSMDEVSNAGYGFEAPFSEPTFSRTGAGTDYAKCQGLYVDNQNSIWWLRTPNDSSKYVTIVINSGYLFFFEPGAAAFGVRPACRLKTLKSDAEIADSKFSELDLARPCAHIWNEGVEVTAPTAVSEGLRTYTCLVCGGTRDETIPALGSETLDPNKVTLSAETAQYNGKEQKPAVTVRNSKGEVLTEGKDYVVRFYGDFTEAGTYNIQVIGMDSYNGEVVKTFTITGNTPPVGGDVMLGDVDGDKKITASDARLALRRAVDIETYPEGSAQFKACDVNKDQKVTASDARMILRAAVDLEDPKSW